MGWAVLHGGGAQSSMQSSGGEVRLITPLLNVPSLLKAHCHAILPTLTSLLDAHRLSTSAQVWRVRLIRLM